MCRLAAAGPPPSCSVATHAILECLASQLLLALWAGRCRCTQLLLQMVVHSGYLLPAGLEAVALGPKYQVAHCQHAGQEACCSLALLFAISLALLPAGLDADAAKMFLSPKYHAAAQQKEQKERKANKARKDSDEDSAKKPPAAQQPHERRQPHPQQPVLANIPVIPTTPRGYNQLLDMHSLHEFMIR